MVLSLPCAILLKAGSHPVQLETAQLCSKYARNSWAAQIFTEGFCNLCCDCRVLQLAKESGSLLNAYELVGVSSDAPSADIKKRYWKLSLMIHPDKCNHAKADDAFQALSQAAKDLQV